jgi:SAM-dependent methyltransferase
MTLPSKSHNTELSFTSDQVEAFWSRIASSSYEKSNKEFDKAHVQRFEISIHRLDLPEDGRLLNLWSRQGEAIPYIRERFPEAELINSEISSVMLKQARNRFPNEIFVECDLQDIDYPDDYFDGILSLEMLEHSPSPQRILEQMFRVLKPGGQLILTCPTKVSEIHLWIADHFFGNHGEGPHRFPSIGRVKKMMSKAGFKLSYHKSTLFVPLELGVISGLNGLFEKIFQWHPIDEFGIRQLYEAHKIAST